MLNSRVPDAWRPWITIVSVLAAITVNALANIIPFNGQNTGQISDRFQIYFVPAGYVFSIWGVIYIGWLAFALFQATTAQRQSPRLVRLGLWFALSNGLNAAWLFCWHYNQFALSLAVMTALLITLIVCYRRLGVGHVAVTRAERWCVDIPFGLYLGWISVATIANAADVLFFIGWSGWGLAPQLWTVLLLGTASAIGAAMAHRHGEIAFPLVLTWAFIGIAQRQSGPHGLPNAGLVITAAWIAAGLAVLLALYGARRRHATG